MSCEKWRLRAQITSTLFFSLRARRCGPPCPPRAAAAGARRAAPLQHLFVATWKNKSGRFKLALRRRLLLAEQDAESSRLTSWLDHAHLRIFHSRNQGNQYALTSVAEELHLGRSLHLYSFPSTLD